MNSSKDQEIQFRRPRWKDSWQVPLFFIGLVCLVLAIGIRIAKTHVPYPKLEEGQKLIMGLIKEGNFEEAITQARSLTFEDSKDPVISNNLKLLLADSLVFRAEKHPKQAEGDYKEATEILNSLSLLNLEQDTTRDILQAKIQILSGHEVSKGLASLEKILAISMDGSEILPLIVQGCLKIQPPDYPRALNANEEFRNIPRLPEEKRLPAQLQAAEILLRMLKADEARKILEKIPDTGPSKLVVKAKTLLAQTYMEESQWQDAADIWKKLLEVPGESTETVGKTLYHFGACLKNLESTAQAEKIWRECAEKGAVNEKVAAALQLAQLYLEVKAREQATSALNLAVRPFKDFGGWDNPYFSRENTQKVFEKAMVSVLENKEYETALRINDAMEKVYLPWQAMAKRAEVLFFWGEYKANEAARLLDGPMAKELVSYSLRLFHEAANCNLQAASLANSPNEKSNQIWVAVTRFRNAMETAKVHDALVRFLNEFSKDGNASQAWYYLGETEKELGNTDAAKEAFQQAVKYRGPFAYRARYQIALIFMEKNELDQASDALEQNLQLLRFDPDTEAQEKSLFALGSLSFLRKNFRLVVRRYEEALERYPKNPQTVRARLQLAESYRQLANQEQQNFILSEKTTPETRSHYQKEHQKWLEKAAEAYQDLELLSATPLGISQLTAEERGLIPLLTAECQFNLGKYEEALGTYARQAARNKGKKEGLHALGGLIRCHSALGQFDLVKQRLADLKDQLSGMDESTRKEWENWITIASGPVKNP